MLNYQRVNATGFQENEVSLPPPVGDFEGRFHWAGASTGDSGDDPFLLEGLEAGRF